MKCTKIRWRCKAFSPGGLIPRARELSLVAEQTVKPYVSGCLLVCDSRLHYWSTGRKRSREYEVSGTCSRNRRLPFGIQLTRPEGAVFMILKIAFTPLKLRLPG